MQKKRLVLNTGAGHEQLILPRILQQPHLSAAASSQLDDFHTDTEDILLDLYSTSTGPALDPYSTSPGPLLGLDSTSTGPPLDRYSTFAGPPLDPYSTSPGPLTGPLLDLHWTSTRPPLEPRRDHTLGPYWLDLDCASTLPRLDLYWGSTGPVGASMGPSTKPLLDLSCDSTIRSEVY